MGPDHKEHLHRRRAVALIIVAEGLNAQWRVARSPSFMPGKATGRKTSVGTSFAERWMRRRTDHRGCRGRCRRADRCRYGGRHRDTVGEGVRFPSVARNVRCPMDAAYFGHDQARSSQLKLACVPPGVSEVIEHQAELSGIGNEQVVPSAVLSQASDGRSPPLRRLGLGGCRRIPGRCPAPRLRRIRERSAHRPGG